MRRVSSVDTRKKKESREQLSSDIEIPGCYAISSDPVGLP
jgi:hypothetical protein